MRQQRKEQKDSTSEPSFAQELERENLPHIPHSALSELSTKIQAKIGKQKPTTTTVTKKPGKSKGRTQTSLNTPKASNGPQGKKRDNSGKVLDLGKKKNDNTATEKQGLFDEQTLKQEIVRLGGSADDFDLIDGVDSASELDGEKSRSSNATKGQKTDSKAFKKDLSAILQDFSGVQGVEDVTSTTSAESESSESSSKSSLSDAPADPRPTPTKETASKSSHKHGKLSIDPGSDWVSLSAKSSPIQVQNLRPVSRDTLQNLHEDSKKLVEEENAEFRREQQSSTASSTFYAQVMTSGTLTDKISALTLAVQESPIHNVKALESLIALARKRSRAQAIEVLRALKDLFAQGTLLPSDRKLRYFIHQQSLLSSLQKIKSWKVGDALPSRISRQELILWAYEDWLKGLYFDFLKILEIWCNDELEFSKARAISYVYELLKEKPEEEANLLRMLVNKLGDPIKKIASRTSHLILELQISHPLMKETIINAIDSDLLLRPNQSLHASYYAIITLNQTVLSSREEQIAVNLLQIYFRLFVALLHTNAGNEAKKRDAVSEKGKKVNSKKSQTSNEKVQESELREKIISAILTGVNRAYPYAGADSSTLTEHMDTLFRITHSSNFNTCVQAMMLIQQLSTTHQVGSDRFYKTLYESLLDARLANSSKQTLYMNLLYKALKSDLSINRIKAFVKRILQILTLHQPSFICGAMHLLHELSKTCPSLSTMITQPEENDSENESFHDVDENDDNPPPHSTPAQLNTSRTPHSAKYSAHKRDPLHAQASASSLWDLLPFLAHYHPTVSLHATHLLQSQPLPGKPDLNLHTLSHFLDRFVYRNPKTAESSTTRGSSIMQPLASGVNQGLLVGGKARGREGPMNADGLMGRRGGEVKAEDVFFQRYFEAVGKSKGKKEKKGKEKEKRAEEEEGGSDEDEDGEEEQVWKAMMESRPDLEGGMEDSDLEDLEMSDLESDFEGSDISSADDAATNANDYEEEGVDGMDGGAPLDLGLDDEDDLLSDDEDAPPGILILTEGSGDKTSKKRRKLKHLPTFASIDDYAEMLGEDDDDGTAGG